MSIDDPFEILGAAADVSDKDLRRAYLRKVREHPPERDPEGFRKVRDAYEAAQEIREHRRLEIDWDESWVEEEDDSDDHVVVHLRETESGELVAWTPVDLDAKETDDGEDEGLPWYEQTEEVRRLAKSGRGDEALALAREVLPTLVRLSVPARDWEPLVLAVIELFARERPENGTALREAIADAVSEGTRASRLRPVASAWKAATELTEFAELAPAPFVALVAAQYLHHVEHGFEPEKSAGRWSGLARHAARHPIAHRRHVAPLRAFPELDLARRIGRRRVWGGKVPLQWLYFTIWLTVVLLLMESC